MHAKNRGRHNINAQCLCSVSNNQTIDFSTAFGSQECEANNEICDEILTTLNGVMNNVDDNDHDVSTSEQLDRNNALFETPCTSGNDVHLQSHQPTIAVRPTARVERMDNQRQSISYYENPSTSIHQDNELMFHMINGEHANHCEYSISYATYE